MQTLSLSCFLEVASRCKQVEAKYIFNEYLMKNLQNAWEETGLGTSRDREPGDMEAMVESSSE